MKFKAGSKKPVCCSLRKELPLQVVPSHPLAKCTCPQRYSTSLQVAHGRKRAGGPKAKPKIIHAPELLARDQIPNPLKTAEQKELYAKQVAAMKKHYLQPKPKSYHALGFAKVCLARVTYSLLSLAPEARGCRSDFRVRFAEHHARDCYRSAE